MTKLRMLASYVVQQWSLTISEKALGREAALILPPALRTGRVDARLPRYQLGALQVLAEDGGESVEAMLMRMGRGADRPLPRAPRPRHPGSHRGDVVAGGPS